jgi:hypothetical protein
MTVSIADDHAVYGPINTLKPVCENVWIVDGPVIRFGMAGLKMPFPTRMTIIRLGDNRLFIHSPTELTDGLKGEIGRIGTPGWIIGPNRLHYWWVADWHEAFPQAEIYLAPKTERQARHPFTFPYKGFDADAIYPWRDDIETRLVEGTFMAEAVFFHRPSRTLVLTDFIENFEPDKIGSLPMKLLARLGGVVAPHGSMPVDMRFTYPKSVLKLAVKAMLDWNPERVILAHGHWHRHHGAAELRRAFRWLRI